MTKIKKGDTIQVMKGKDAGKKGEVLKVLEVFSKGIVKTMVIVKGVNVVKRSRKPNPQLGIQGGVIEIEKPVDASNVMYFDDKAGKPSRVGFKVDASGKKVRFAKKSGEIIK